MEIHVKARDGGPVSSALVRRVGVGDVLRLGPPVGHLALHDDSDRDLLLVAGGMGLAPLKALVDQVARKGPARRVDLFVGSRTEDHDLRPGRPAAARAGEPLADGHLRRLRGQDLRAWSRATIGDVVMRHGPWLSREVYVAGPARDGGGHGRPAPAARRATQRIPARSSPPADRGPVLTER